MNAQTDDTYGIPTLSEVIDLRALARHAIAHAQQMQAERERLSEKFGIPAEIPLGSPFMLLTVVTDPPTPEDLQAVRRAYHLPAGARILIRPLEKADKAI